MSDQDQPAIEQNETAADGPLGQFLGDTAQDAELEFARPRPKLSVYQMMIGAVVVLSAGSIYGMRAYGMNKGIDFAATEIVVPEGGTAADRESFEVVLARLDRSDRPVQVPIDRIGKDPFSLGEFAAKRVNNDDNAEELARKRAAEEAQRLFEQRQREIEEALGKVFIQSLMGGRSPVASINGELYSAGEMFEDVLKIHRINPSSVTFEVDGELYEIGVAERYEPDED